MNSTSECVFSSVPDVLNLAQENTTKFVQLCPSACLVVIGDGNPDLSGIGVNISYKMQLVFVYIFGPAFLLASCFKAKSPSCGYIARLLAPLRDTFFDANAQFALGTFIAAAIRLSQQPSLYEMSCLMDLVRMQAFSLAAIIPQGGFFLPTGMIRRVLAASYLVAGFLGMLHSSMRIQPTRGPIMSLAHACVNHVLPKPTSSLRILELYETSVFNVDMVLLMFVAFLMALPLLFDTRRNGHFFTSFSFLSSWWSLGCSCVSWYSLRQIERARGEIQSLAGTEFQDNQWGYGQVLAVILWIPLSVQLLFNIVKTVFQL
ncbi:hypothetical protein BDN72DRAFT_860584 [Pluteus cervinus]|uniref:Uncharacterized protein n=1 Tax=Pluteus cervinus TaxID=181527 RepID=A0ACD3AHV4_9AGAR|nr:hypothetical protein BDN72DRAFT_860584 [Pluteus cervinus]